MSMFFLSNPTLVIKAGLSYCLGEGFGTQLSPNPANGQPITDGPYPPFPPVADNPGLASFNFTSATAATDHGYSDGTNGNPVIGVLNSGGGTGGATLNAFFAQNLGTHTLNFVLLLTGALSLPAQDCFTGLSFTDENGNVADLLSAFAGSSYPNGGGYQTGGYSNPTGNTAQWSWTCANPADPVFVDGTAYPVTVT